MIYCDLMALENYFEHKNIFHRLTGLALTEVQLATSTVCPLLGKQVNLTHLVSDIKSVL